MSSTFSIFIAGDRVDLVALTRDLAANSPWWRWFNDEAVTRLMQQHYYPNTPESQVEFFEELRKDKRRLQLGVVHKQDQLLIGMVSLGKIDERNRKCEISGIIGERKYQNLVYATEAFNLLLAHAFDQLNMHRVHGGTIIREVADMFVRVLGFKDEGVLRQDVWKNGRYHDIHRIGLLREEYLARRREGGE